MDYDPVQKNTFQISESIVDNFANPSFAQDDLSMDNNYQNVGNVNQLLLYMQRSLLCCAVSVILSRENIFWIRRTIFQHSIPSTHANHYIVISAVISHLWRKSWLKNNNKKTWLKDARLKLILFQMPPVWWHATFSRTIHVTLANNSTVIRRRNLDRTVVWRHCG